MKEKIKKNKIVLGAVAVLIISGLVFLFQYNIVNATSGACSSHNGVNCSMGRQLNGKVYCNDGWTDSMVVYDFMVACKNHKLGCSMEEWENLSKKYKIEELYSASQKHAQETEGFLTQIQEDLKRVKETTGLASIREPRIAQATEDANAKIYAFQSVTAALSQQIAEAWSFVERECDALGAVRRLNREQELEKIKLDYSNAQIKAEQDRLAQIKKDNEKLQKLTEDYNNALKNASNDCLSSNATLVGNSCKCNAGYFIYNDYPNQCISPTNYCKLKYGDHIFANDTNCVCESGYVWNGIKCIKIEDKPVPTFTAPMPTPTPTPTPTLTPVPTPIFTPTPIQLQGTPVIQALALSPTIDKPSPTPVPVKNQSPKITSTPSPIISTSSSLTPKLSPSPTPAPKLTNIIIRFFNWIRRIF